MLQKGKDKREKYIVASQAISFFLLAIVILSAVGFKESVAFKISYYHFVTVMFCTLLPLIPLVRFLSNNYHNNIFFEFFIYSIIYFMISAIFLTYVKDTSFKILLIMPVIISAIKYGTKFAFCTSFCSLIIMLFVSYKNKFAYIDSDLMYLIIFFLVAWLLGNMKETESNIRNELERLASHDGLTNLYNHRSFHNIMDSELARTDRNKTSLSLLLLDIDYFKVYNDSFGHQKGDFVLKKVAEILKNSITEGYCTRYGGEEFAVILPDMDINKAKTVGESIRKKIEEAEFPGMEVLPKGKLTVSIGIAEYPLMADSKERLIQKADEALYKAKSIGKNKVETYYSVFDELSLSLKGEEKEIFNSIRTLTMIINAKDKYTYGHSERTMQMAKKLAERMALNESFVKDLVYGALLHDIGKIEIAREILNKPTKLNENEWEVLKQHPQWGADMIRPLKSLTGAVEIVLYHHENYDGSGYPQGLKGTDIPYGARILRIIDSFDAITTNRPYKEAMSEEQALEELKRYSGIHYDPVLLNEFTNMVRSSSGRSNQVS